MTLDTVVQADILSTCNALGSEIKGIYEKGNDCIECLKDILRYLKRDNDDHSVLLFLGSIRLLQTDLLPIIKRYDKHKEIFDFTLRILVALTSPALLLYKEDLPDDKLSRNVYLQLITHLQSYKKAFIDTSVWEILYEHLKELLKTRPIERSSDENLLIERIVILIRNILHVPADDCLLKITDDDLSPHDKILQCLHESKINILLLYISANEEEHQYCLHIIEIVSLMLREHVPEVLAKSNETRSTEEKEKDLSILMAARQRELNLKLQKVQAMSTRRFNGVYCVKNMKSISNNDYIAHRFITNANDIKFDQMKDSKRKPKNRVRASDVENARHSTLKIRLFLKKFCIEFLKTYNKLMVSIKRELLRKVSDEHDDTYYLWAISYFMEFNRLYNFQPALVSETISMQSFHYIQTQITNYQDMMMTDKKKAVFWAKRMQLGVNTYKELLETLVRMERSEDEIIKESADALISHVFYAIEYREMLWSLLSNYDEVKFPLSYLAKLVESSQLFLKMLENHAKKHSEIIVQKKQRKVRRKKKKKTVECKEPVNIEDQLNEQWDAVSSELSMAVQGFRPIPEVTPFDCASEMSFEDQKVEAVYKIREVLISNEPFKAVGLLRAARELWPEGDSFGASDVEPEPEFLILREIHFSNIQKNPGESCPVVEEEDSEENEEEMEAAPSFTEQKLDMDEIYKKYATHKVIKHCSLLLSNYQKNKPQTNLCLVKLLHRIAWNCKMHALFFQSSIFVTFQKIFHDPDANSDPIIKEFYRFAKFITQKFFEVAEKNNKIFVEFLFWKGPREAYELEEGYGTSESKVKLWTEEEDEELRYLFEENKDICIEGQDVADIIAANLPSSRTKQQVVKALKRLGLISSTKELKPQQRKEWLETEIVELQHLFEDYKNSDNVMANILDKLSIKRSRKAVTEKLLELNLVQDRKELRKKSSKSGKRSNRFDDSDASSDENDILFNEDVPDLQTAAESSNDEDEENFFENLKAERLAEATEENNNNLSSIKISNKDNSTNENNSQIWEEQEIMILTSVFQENRESDDIMQMLTTALPKKKPKKEIVNKLLELGLIKDKKEIKKRKSKTTDHGLLAKKSNISQDLENDSDQEENDVKVSNRMSIKNKKRHILDSSDEDESGGVSALKDLNKNKNVGEKSNIKEKVWNEEEVVALTQLYLEHKDSEDVTTTIIKHLPFKTTKKSIIEKLLETSLIKDKKEVKNSNTVKRKRLPDVWEEQEVLELTQLFQSNIGSSDIMSDILQGLTVKRQKQKVIDKMLELGLIQDKKEVRKKKASKPGAMQGKEGKQKRTSKQNELSVNHNKRNVKIVSSDESEDDMLPLSQMVTSTAKNDSKNFPPLSQSYSDISLEEKISTLSKSLKEVHEENEADRQDTGSNEIQNVRDVKTNKRKRHLIISDDSSDDDATLSTLVGDSEDVEVVNSNPSYSEIYLEEKISSLKEVHEDTEADRQDSGSNAVQNDKDVKTNKRKRHLIISDDSSDDDATLSKHMGDSEDVEILNNNPTEQYHNDLNTIKSLKKKIRVLDDSDDSS